ncbi:MAG: DinB family protein [Bacteroidetes bacterium]|nr:DinB family protein [Bacteroidota bacterium]
MVKQKIEMLLEIHKASSVPLYSVMNGITEIHANWRPTSESRSVNQIIRHLIRVDNYFLQRLNQEQEYNDPVDGKAYETTEALKNIHQQIQNLISNCADDSELFLKSSINDADDGDTINNHILHSCQHNLYHLSQVIYLRRALDRQWESPLSEWDYATRVIAKYLLQ